MIHFEGTHVRPTDKKTADFACIFRPIVANRKLASTIKLDEVSSGLARMLQTKKHESPFFGVNLHLYLTLCLAVQIRLI